MRPTGGVGVAGRAGWAAGSWGELWEEALRGWGAVKGPAIDLPVLGKREVIFFEASESQSKYVLAMSDSISSLRSQHFVIPAYTDEKPIAILMDGPSFRSKIAAIQDREH